jgi:hypothetical protein
VLDAQATAPENLNTTLKELDDFWATQSEEILNAFASLTNVSFKKDDLVCYVNTAVSISDPLSLKIESIENMKDNLIHELTHVFLTQNYEHIKDKWHLLMNTFSNESQLTRTHIAVHAIHLEIVKKIMPERVETITLYSQNEDYVKAWEIVKQNTSGKIIKMLF